MEKHKITTLQNIFSSRLDTLSHLLKVAESHFAEDLESVLRLRIAPDMFPFGTQIIFTCNQPRNFALWCLEKPESNLNPDVASLKELLANINVIDTKLSEIKRVELGQGLYAELLGLSYVDDFLMPNFYFHLTTAYDILRMAGVPVGKRDFMMHLVPFVNHQSDA